MRSVFLPPLAPLQPKGMCLSASLVSPPPDPTGQPSGPVQYRVSMEGKGLGHGHESFVLVHPARREDKVGDILIRLKRAGRD
jgi:hypothetical protein